MAFVIKVKCENVSDICDTAFRSAYIASILFTHFCSVAYYNKLLIH